MYNAKITRPDFESKDKVVALTATIKSGLVTKTKQFSVVVKREGLTDEQSAIKDASAIVIPLKVSSNITFPLTGANGTTITWSSVNTGVISNTGVITRPAKGEPEETIQVTARVTKGAASQEKQFSITVLPWTAPEELEDAVAKVTWELIKGNNVDKNNVTEQLIFPSTVGRSISVKTWKSSNEAFCKSTGEVTRPTYTQGPININVTCILEHDGKSKTVVLDSIWIKPKEITNTEVVELAKAELVESIFLGTNVSLSSITESMKLPKFFDNTALKNASIVWSLLNSSGGELSNSAAISITDNTTYYNCIITRPSHGDGNYQCRLKANITANIEGDSPHTDNKQFTITILKQDSIS